MVSHVTLEGSFMRKSVHVIAAAISLLSTGAMAADSSLSACGTSPYISQASSTGVPYSTLYNTNIPTSGATLKRVTGRINYDPPSFGTLWVRVCHQNHCPLGWQQFTAPNYSFDTTLFTGYDATISLKMEAMVRFNGGTRLVNRSGKSSCATVYYSTP